MITKTPPSEVERRVNVGNIEIRNTAKAPRIVGHAALFNSLSADLGGFRERFMPGCFREAIIRDDVRALQNSDANRVLGRTRAGTLRLREDALGLAAEIDLPNTSTAADLLKLMARGDVDQLSLSFRVAKADQSWARTGKDGPWVRSIHRVTRLHDVSVSTYAEQAETSAAVRQLRAHQVRSPAAASRERLLSLLEIRPNL